MTEQEAVAKNIEEAVEKLKQNPISKEDKVSELLEQKLISREFQYREAIYGDVEEAAKQLGYSTDSFVFYNDKTLPFIGYDDGFPKIVSGESEGEFLASLKGEPTTLSNGWTFTPPMLVPLYNTKTKEWIKKIENV